MYRIALALAIYACTPKEAPPLGSRPRPVTPSALRRPFNPPTASAFVADQPRADPLADPAMEPHGDAGVDALLPPESPLPDAGLIPDGGSPMIR